ncbi:GMC family oxidoreductase [Humitalea sp. 24SJ18S-53]|uniref:GMC family oxidoreductase n=1 Tax=Humitalea sp. 24SJ18S-53 TaxID=3422307 RepID=UPI003D67D033
MRDADTIIIGGGTAGCVLAARLSEDPGHRVLLLEAGPPDRNPWIHIPAGVSKLIAHPVLNWRLRTAPEANGRDLYWPSGKMLGGSSSLNGMTYIRGQAEDYDEWAVPGWSAADVLPVFDALEADPFSVGEITYRHPMPELARQAALAIGIPHNEDFNGATQAGVGWYRVAMRNGRRMSAATAYLAPARGRKNLEVVTGAQVSRIVFDQGRASGVMFGDGQTATARKNVVLCAGAVGSPHLLQVSGIGDGAHLQGLGVPVVADVPEVGRNLQEQVRAEFHMRCRHPTFNQEARFPRLVGHVLRYALARRGLLTTTGSQVAMFLCSGPDVARPDTQINIRPASGEYRGNAGFTLHDFPGATAFACNLRPASRGHVLAASADARVAPRITANLLADPADLRPVLHGIRVLRRLIATEPLRSEVVEELRPGAAIQTDEALEAHVRDVALPLYHAAGTCRMGTDAGSVLDAELRVRGVAGLRVVDASVMPRVTSGNTMAPVLMIAEMAARMMRA